MSPGARRLLLASAPLLALLGLALDQVALVALAASIALMLLEARWTAGRSAAGLWVDREVGSTAYEDDAVAVELRLENRGGRAVALVELGDCFEPGLADQQRVLEHGPLGPSRARRLRYRTRCSRRWGEYHLGPLSATAGDPLGLWSRTRVYAAMVPFAVLPRPVPMPGLERLGARPSMRLQSVTAPRAGQSLAFLGVREYRPGDERRRIHWPATAHRGAPVVKEHEVDRVPYFTLLLDLDRAHRSGTGRRSSVDCVVRTAASLVTGAARQGHMVQVIGEDAEPLRVAPGSGAVHLTRCLLELVRLRQQGTTPFLDLVERSLVLLQPGSTAAMLCGASGLEQRRLEEALAALERHGVQPLVVLVHDASFTAIDRRSRTRKEADAHCADLCAALRARGVAGARVDSEAPLAVALQHLDWAGP